MNDMSTKNRADLKAYFVKNAIPTEANFADLIDSMLNQKDDGLVKGAGAPLKIEAVGAADTANEKRVISLFKNLADANPLWSISLNPRTDPANPGTAHLGFNISDGAGNSRLFIDSNTGGVGIGTITPGTSKLAVAGDTTLNGALVVSGAAALNNGLSVTGNVSVSGDTTLNHGLSVSGGMTTLSSGLTVGSATAPANTTLNGVLTVSNTANLNHGLVVSGAMTTLSNGLTVGSATTSANTTLNGALTVSGAANLNNGLNVSGAMTTLSNGLIVGSAATPANTSLHGGLTVFDDTTLNGALTVTGLGSLDGLSVTLDADVGGSLKANSLLFPFQIQEGYVTIGGKQVPVLKEYDGSLTPSSVPAIGGSKTLLLTLSFPQPGGYSRKFVIDSDVNVTGQITNISDERDKQDIEALSYGLDEIKRLHPVAFNRKSSSRPHKSLGLIAQQVEPVMREIVDDDGRDTPDRRLSIAYLELIPVLINAVKELDAKVEQIASGSAVN